MATSPLPPHWAVQTLESLLHPWPYGSFGLTESCLHTPTRTTSKSTIKLKSPGQAAVRRSTSELGTPSTRFQGGYAGDKRIGQDTGLHGKNHTGWFTTGLSPHYPLYTGL